MKTMSYQLGADGVAIVTLDDPTRPMNVVSPEFIEDMLEVIANVSSDDAVKGAVICSGKPAFMAGADLKFFLASMEADVFTKNNFTRLGVETTQPVFFKPDGPAQELCHAIGNRLHRKLRIRFAFHGTPQMRQQDNRRALFERQFDRGQ